MEFFAFLIGLFFLISIILPWVNASRLNGMRDELDELHKDMAFLQKHGIKATDTNYEEPVLEEAPEEVMEELPADDIAIAPEVIEDIPEEVVAEEIPNIDNDPNADIGVALSSVPTVEHVEDVKEKRNTFEQNIATKLPVWLGSA